MRSAESCSENHDNPAGERLDTLVGLLVLSILQNIHTLCIG